MDSSAVKQYFCDHSLLPSARFIFTTCGICKVKGPIYCGYFRDGVWCHKECGELPSEIHYPLHPQHPRLKLINGQNNFCATCSMCGDGILSYYYFRCSTCDFPVHLSCGMKPPPPAIEHPICHDHPLVLLKKPEEKFFSIELPIYVSCEVCKDSFDGPSYSCLECHVYFHVDCALLLKEVNHPCHSYHPLKFISSKSLTDDAEKICIFCGEEPKNMLYHCSICNFTACLGCTKNPRPMVIEHAKIHKHPLTFFSRRVSCTCKACGKQTSFPYMCLQCSFAVHGWCIDLPRVININRHDHRVSFTLHLGPGYLKCGVCRRSVCQYNGAYSCSRCPHYAVHSKCATRNDVSNGVELEGKPEVEEDNVPFEVVGDYLIKHFSHKKHTLRLQANNTIHVESARCEACSHPVGFDPIYSCDECCFILHENCANLPMKKRLVFDTLPFRLFRPDEDRLLDCNLCGMFYTGFVYNYQGRWREEIDVHCGSLSEPFVHGGHSHPLYFYYHNQSLPCNACHKEIHGYMLSCDACEFKLCLWCASLPTKIKHVIDDHPLTLCCGEKANENYWCDICERVLDPSRWFYTSFECGVTVHVECVLGDFSRLSPGSIRRYKGYRVEAVLNNHNTRPLCRMCSSRCKVPIIVKVHTRYFVRSLCSRLCFMRFFG